TQRVSDWRSNFGSTAATLVVDFFNLNRDTPPQELGQLFLHQYAFLYPDPENIDKSETFRSAFVQELLASAHLSRIAGHANVPALDTDTLAESGIIGALGLCAVSLERAFTLIAENTVAIDVPDAPAVGRKARLKTPKTLNRATGKESGTEHAFSVAKWGAKNCRIHQRGTEEGHRGNKADDVNGLQIREETWLRQAQQR
ncbi:hypothetical protein DEU56DRAFT_732261, partial [Suillus clintonianus]|uniref:uncharacterized protein n=1 Tax=Suillus clintonianus TaxID=1904413 RepID=UPI001B8767D7